jgi:glycosyltransferase involved in cell wall biosynthesis
VRDDIPALLARARALVLPSAGEGNSNALLEALAAGTPVVASMTPGNLEVLSDGEGGLLVPVDDEEALAAALIRVLDEDALAAELSERARRRARAFDLDGAASAWTSLLDEAVRTPAGPAIDSTPSLTTLAARGIARAARNVTRRLGLLA